VGRLRRKCRYPVQAPYVWLWQKCSLILLHYVNSKINECSLCIQFNITTLLLLRNDIRDIISVTEKDDDSQNSWLFFNNYFVVHFPLSVSFRALTVYRRRPGLPGCRTHHQEQPTGQRDISPVSVNFPSASKNISVPGLIP